MDSLKNSGFKLRATLRLAEERPTENAARLEKPAPRGEPFQFLGMANSATSQAFSESADRIEDARRKLCIERGTAVITQQSTAAVDRKLSSAQRALEQLSAFQNVLSALADRRVAVKRTVLCDSISYQGRLQTREREWPFQLLIRPETTERGEARLALWLHNGATKERPCFRIDLPSRDFAHVNLGSGDLNRFLGTFPTGKLDNHWQIESAPSQDQFAAWARWMQRQLDNLIPGMRNSDNFQTEPGS